MEGVKKKVKELGMTADPGPEIEGYVPKGADELYNVSEEGREVEAEDQIEDSILDVAPEDEEEEELWSCASGSKQVSIFTHYQKSVICNMPKI